jgi:hypothetical protein
MPTSEGGFGLMISVAPSEITTDTTLLESLNLYAKVQVGAEIRSIVRHSMQGMPRR